MKKKTKRGKKRWRKGTGIRAIYGIRGEKLLDKEAEYVLDSYPMPPKLDRQNLDDLTLDEDDVNYKIADHLDEIKDVEKTRKKK